MDSNAIRLLERFGLTEYEAKTLATLFSLGQAQAPEISRLAEVPKTRVYDVLEKLMQKKLVLEVNGRPKKYMVVELDSALAHLVESKKNELTELEQSTSHLRNAFSKSGKTEVLESEKVFKVKDKTDFLKIVSQELDKAEHDIVGFTKFDHQHALFKQMLTNAAKKNVNIRLLTHAPANLENLVKGSGKIQAKHAAHDLTALVIDQNRVILALSDLEKTKPEYHFSIWPQNPHLAEAITNYFDKRWKENKSN